MRYLKAISFIFFLFIVALQFGCASTKSSCETYDECFKEAKDKCSLLQGTRRANCEYSAFENLRAIKQTEKGFFQRWADNIGESRRQEELKAQEAQRQAAIALQNKIQNQCRGYGFQMGTPAMANCVMQIDLAHKQLQQQQQQAEAAYNQKVQQCRSMWGQGMGQPTMSGSFGESLGNANTAYQNCMAGVPTAPTQVICNRSPNPQVNYVYCTTR
jgi:hypothetical protein